MERALNSDPKSDGNLPKTSILFVDDEERILAAMQRLLHTYRDRWNLLFVDNSAEALSIVKEQSVDVIVADIRMPNISGLELLKIIKESHPTILRIGLSGTADEEQNLTALNLAHHFLPKPVSRERLVNTLEKNIALRGIIENEALKNIVSQLSTLPSLPIIYTEIMSLIHSGDCSVKEIGQTVSKDIGMSTKVLQLINSAYFGLRREVTNPVQAVVFLGLNTIKSLVLTIKIFSSFEDKNISRDYINQLWQHSLNVARYARQIARQERLSKAEYDNLLSAGLLHDVGKLVIAANFPEEFRQIQSYIEEQGYSGLQAEQAVLNSNHCDVGAYLFGLWGLPTTLISACAFHHYPERYGSDAITAVNIIHIANIFDHCFRSEMSTDELQLEQDYFSSIGWQEKIEIWADACRNIEKENWLFT